jgi:magnesium chelatase accessory protein
MRWPVPHDWPHAEHSRQVFARPHRWHVQDMGDGPPILLLHGAGASTHSFRALMPLLAQRHRVVAVDLPGQGFTRLGARHRCTLPAMAEDLAVLCGSLDVNPAVIVGHSAGGAIALRLSQMLDGTQAVIGLNPALAHFRGMAAVLFPAMARVLALTPFSATVMSRASGGPERIASLISGTGSKLDARGVDLYRRLANDEAHVDGTLLMMAGWSLEGLLADLPRIGARTLFLAAEGDRAVPPRVSGEAAPRMPDATVVTLPGLGHLAHEEDPDLIARHILDFAGT